MKFMIEYTIRNAGMSCEQNMANQEALLNAFSKWSPEDGLKVGAFLAKVSGSAGYVLAEAEDARTIQAFIAKFTFWNDVEVIPVTDVGDAVNAARASLAWVRSAVRA